MIFSGDPYRTLGLPPGAPLAEVKRAYRRLAKQLHPDTAGPAALPRFLAVKAAYEMLAGSARSRPTGRAGASWASGAGNRAGPGGGPAGGSGRSSGGGAGGGWQSRTGPRGGWPSGGSPASGGGSERASGRDAGTGPRTGAGGRDAPPGGRSGGSPRGDGPAGERPAGQDPFAWARQGRRPSSEGSRPAGPGGPARGAAGTAGGAGDSARERSRRRGGPASAGRSTGGGETHDSEGVGGGSGTATGQAGSGRGGSGPRWRRVPTRRATLGSTSYDDALHDEGQAWHGAAWYGVTTGTYWRPNPREYADPRKHGPEYEERARRAAAGLSGPEASSEPWSGSGRGTTANDRAAGGDRAGGSDRAASGDRAPRDGTASPTGDRSGPSPRTGPTAAFAASSTLGDRPTRPRSPSSSASSPATTSRTSSLDGLAVDLADRLVLALVGTPTRARLTLALAGWPLLALLAVDAAGELTGCGRFAAGCPLDADLWTSLSQLTAVALLVLLVARPPLAVRATIASLVAVAVAVPGAVLLAAFGGSRDPAGASGALALLVALAWLGGAIGAATGRLRLPPTWRARVPWWS